MCEIMLLARIISAQAWSSASCAGSVTTGGSAASHRYRFTRRRALARAAGAMSPAVQEAVAPLQVPSLRSARSAVQRAHTAAAPSLLPALPPRAPPAPPDIPPAPVAGAPAAPPPMPVDEPPAPPDVAPPAPPGVAPPV